MPYILNIETATEVCSVSISCGADVIFFREDLKGPSHAVLLGQFVKDAFDFMRGGAIKPDAVSVSCGPGSYTGLRIGVSEAKGLCYGLDIPLIAVNTLKILAWTVAGQKLTDRDVLLCPMIDARRMEVYDAVFDHDLNPVKETSADIIDGASFSGLLQEHKIAFFGNGASKVKTVLDRPNAIFLDNIYPSAGNMAVLSDEAYKRKEFVDIAYFEPFYLKEFVATTPKNKVLPTNNPK